MSKNKAFFKRIELYNFKSFEHLDVPLNMFNCLIGANASGKSNFVSVFKFLRDICKSGLDNAISLQGGAEFITNVNDKSKPLKIKFILSIENTNDFSLMKTPRNAINLKEIMYSFEISFFEEKFGLSYKIKEERMETLADFKETVPGKRTKKIIGEVRIKSCLEDSKLEFNVQPKELNISLGDVFPLINLEREINEAYTHQKDLRLLQALKPGPNNISLARYFTPMSSFVSSFLSSISIFDIDPKLCKRSSVFTGTTNLEPDGSNLAIALRNILIDEEKKKSFSTIIRDLLPFIDSLSVERLADTSVITCVKEMQCVDRAFPAPLISDGTINLTALVLALNFDEGSIVIIEEPEKNIHPQLISKIVQMMKDVSERNNKQVFMTTHNAEAIRSVESNNILLVYREAGVSKISRPVEKKEVQEFLKNDMGIDELFVQGMLQW